MLLCLIIPTGKWVPPISKSFPLLPCPTQVSSTETHLTTLLILTSHKALLFLTAFPFPWPGFHSHAFLILLLLLLVYPLFCIFHITQAFWTFSSNLFEGLPQLHPTCSSYNVLCFIPLGQVSNLNNTVTDCPFPKTKANVLGPNPELICISLVPLISGEGCKLRAAHTQLHPRAWLQHITLRVEKFSLPQ